MDAAAAAPRPGSDRSAPLLRPGARVILLDGRDRVLLFRHRVPGALRDHWITPGGALEPGETHAQAAARELWEETGLRDAALGPWVWWRRQTWRWDETWYDSPERFTLVRVERHAVRPRALGASERRSMREHRWWSVAEVAAATGELFIPGDLARLLPPLIAGDLPAEPIEVGE